MRIELHHCLLFILLIAITQVLVAGAPSSRTRINIRETEENCTRNGDILICPCDVFVNRTYYPCWTAVTNATVPLPNNTCSECPLGSFSNNGTGNCTLDNICPPGACLDPYRCDLCPVGHYANVTGASVCTACAAGYVARDQGAINCTACPPGFDTEDSTGRSACVGCYPGYYSPNWGTPDCLMCELGTYSSGKSDACVKCPRGTYNDKRGQAYTGCNGCGKGFYGDDTGFTTHAQCKLCPEGTYCPDAITTEPVQCPRGSYCTAGATTAIKCASLYDSDLGQSKCKPGVGFYIVLFGSICIAGIGFLIIWRWRRVKQERLQRSYQQTEIDRLIPKPRDGGPVYTGF